MRLTSTLGASAELNVSERRVRKLCLDGRIAGAQRIGRDWVIPSPVQVAAVKRGRPFANATPTCTGGADGRIG